MQYQLSLGSLSLGTPLTWEGNPNFHIYMTGNSGQGKTFLSRSLASQIPGMGGRCIIFDYSGDFIAECSQQNWPIAGSDVIDVRSGDITINPFLPENDSETHEEIAERVVALLSSGIRFGIAQWAYLYGNKKGFLSSLKTSYNLLFARNPNFLKRFGFHKLV